MNFFYGRNGGVHSAEKDELASRASELEKEVPAPKCEQPAEGEQKSVVQEAPNHISNPDVIGKMNHNHTLAMFLTSRVGSRVRVDVSGDTIEGTLRNVGSDYLVIHTPQTTTIIPYTFIKTLSMA